MADTPVFVVAPPPRCYQQLPDCEPGICGAAATWRRRDPSGRDLGFYCAEHKRPEDVPLAGEISFRRVSVTFDALFAGTSPMQSMAHAEVVARLERAVEGIGGVINLHAVNSVVGRSELPPARQPARTGGDGA